MLFPRDCLEVRGLIFLRPLVAKPLRRDFFLDAAGCFGGMLVQAVGLSIYTAVLMPLCYLGLKRIRSWLIVSVTRRSRR